MLALIGIGLDSKDISVKALEFLKSADIVLLESYTSIIGSDSTDFIARETGKELVRTRRSDFEDNLKGTVKKAKASTVAILVIGDPLVATTHHIILDEAMKQGVEIRIFHAPSIFSAAIGESGLDIYKFGPTTTIPFWSEHYKPTSFVDSISKNLRNGEHTLVLLDINQAEGKPMPIDYAMETFENALKQTDDHGIKKSSILVLADIGRKSQKIFYTQFSKAASLSAKLNGNTISLIVPTKLNFAEEESLKRFAP